MHSYLRQPLVGTTEACFNEISALCADLSKQEWGVQSLCPAWTVRQALGHAVGVENVIAGWEISTEPPMDEVTDLGSVGLGRPPSSRGEAGADG